MPMPLDTIPEYTLDGPLRPELDLLDRMPFGAPALIAAAVALAVTAALTLVRRRSRPPSPCIGGVMPREEALDHLRRVKAELKGRKGEAAVAEVLARAGLPALHDVVLRDGRGLTQVDHLVQLPGGIVVLETKAFAGMVLGGLRDRHWVQHLRDGAVRTAFLNPLLQNHRHVRAVREKAGAGVPVAGLVVSAGAGRFCGELEAAVVRLAELAGRLCALQTTTGRCDPARLDAAWARLTAAAACGEGLRGAHGEHVRRRRGETGCDRASVSPAAYWLAEQRRRRR